MQSKLNLLQTRPLSRAED